MKNNKNRQELFKIIKSQAYTEGKFVLSSGKISDYYIDCRKITLTSKGVYLAAILILDIIKNKNIDAIGGPTIGADPMVGAICALSKNPIKGFLVRKAAKTHGMGRQIEGPGLKKGSRVVVIDDVATSGGSIIDAITALKNAGIKIDSVIVLVDRNQGAKENLEKLGCNFLSIFNIEEFRKK